MFMDINKLYSAFVDLSCERYQFCSTGSGEYFFRPHFLPSMTPSTSFPHRGKEGEEDFDCDIVKLICGPVEF